MKKIIAILALTFACFTSAHSQIIWNYSIGSCGDPYDYCLQVQHDTIFTYFPLFRIRDTSMCRVFPDTLYLSSVSATHNISARPSSTVGVMTVDANGKVQRCPSDSIFVAWNNVTSKPAIATVSSVSNSVSRSINGTGFQVSSTKACEVKYVVQIATTLSLSGGQTGTVFLETSPNNSTWTEIDRFVNGNTGTLTVGLNITQTISGNLTAYVPAGYYVRLRSTSSGSPTITYLNGQEVLY